MYLLDDFAQRLVSFYILNIKLFFISLTFRGLKMILGIILRAARPATALFFNIIQSDNPEKAGQDTLMYIRNHNHS